MTMIRPGNSNSGRRALLPLLGCQRGSCWRTASDFKLFQKMWAKSLTQILSIGYFFGKHIQKDWVLVNFKRRNVQLGCLWGYRLNDCLEFSSKDSRAKQTIETFSWQRFHGKIGMIPKTWIWLHPLAATYMLQEQNIITMVVLKEKMPIDIPNNALRKSPFVFFYPSPKTKK